MVGQHNLPKAGNRVMGLRVSWREAQRSEHDLFFQIKKHGHCIKLGRKTLSVLKCVKFSFNINLARLSHCFTSAQVSMNILTSRFQLYFGESSTWSVVLSCLSCILIFKLSPRSMGVCGPAYR